VADVGVSAVTGIGLDVLRAQLVDMLTALPKPDGSADVRLWVDRVFTVRGAGTVVTGTLPAGTIEIGDELAIGGEQIRVRGLQTLGDDVDVVAGSARVAIRVGGASAELRRGVALTTPGAWLHTSVIDVRLRRPADTPPRRLTLHVGAASLSCEVRLLGPAAMGLLRLRLDRPVPLRVGDRCLLRDPGDRRVWGVRVLDPAPPALTRRGAALARAQELAATPDEPDLDDELRRRGVVTRSFLRQVGVPQRQLDAAPGVRDGWLLAKSTAAELRRRLCEEIARHDREVPLDPGLTPAMAAQRLGLPDHSALGSLIHPPVVMADGRLRLAGTGALPDDVQAAVTQLRALLHEDPFAAPDAAGLTALGLDTRRLAAAARAGELLRLADQVVLLPGADTMAVARLRDLPQPFTASEARQALGTSRRVVLPLLAHLDRLGATRRLSDDRRLLV
jgi:selenocysteine-specific elongation factor